MDHSRAKIGRFLAESDPIDGCWKETRLAFNMNGRTYLVTNNFPRWNVSAILEWLKDVGITPFEIEVTVTTHPVADKVWEKPTPGYNSNGTINHKHNDWSSEYV